MIENETITRASVAVIVADLLVLQSQHGLPALNDLYATSSNGIVTLNLYSADAQVIWADALDIPAAARSIHRYTDRSPIHTAYAARQGWSVHVKYDGPDAPGESLPAETVAALKVVSADADTIKAEALAEPKADPWQQFLTVACPACKAAVGEEYKGRSAQWSHINRRNLSAPRPVEVQPDAEAKS